VTGRGAPPGQVILGLGGREQGTSTGPATAGAVLGLAGSITIRAAAAAVLAGT